MNQDFMSTFGSAPTIEGYYWKENLTWSCVSDPMISVHVSRESPNDSDQAK